MGPESHPPSEPFSLLLLFLTSFPFPLIVSLPPFAPLDSLFVHIPQPNPQSNLLATTGEKPTRTTRAQRPKTASQRKSGRSDSCKEKSLGREKGSEAERLEQDTQRRLPDPSIISRTLSDGVRNRGPRAVPRKMRIPEKAESQTRRTIQEQQDAFGAGAESSPEQQSPKKEGSGKARVKRERRPIEWQPNDPGNGLEAGQGFCPSRRESPSIPPSHSRKKGMENQGERLDRKQAPFANCQKQCPGLNPRTAGRPWKGEGQIHNEIEPP